MSWFVYVVRVKPPANRNAVMKALAEHGIPSRPSVISPHSPSTLLRRTVRLQARRLPRDEALGDVSLSVISLPFSGVMSEEQVEHVCGAVKEAVVHSHK